VKSRFRFRFSQKHRLTEFSVSVNRNIPTPMRMYVLCVCLQIRCWLPSKFSAMCVWNGLDAKPATPNRSYVRRPKAKVISILVELKYCLIINDEIFPDFIWQHLGKRLGYVYMIFESEKSVKLLLQNCTQDYNGSGDYYFKLTSRRMRTKEIRQVWFFVKNKTFWMVASFYCWVTFLNIFCSLSSIFQAFFVLITLFTSIFI